MMRSAVMPLFGVTATNEVIKIKEGDKAFLTFAKRGHGVRAVLADDFVQMIHLSCGRQLEARKTKRFKHRIDIVALRAFRQLRAGSRISQDSYPEVADVHPTGPSPRHATSAHF
jgi:hypothetical protein